QVGQSAQAVALLGVFAAPLRCGVASSRRYRLSPSQGSALGKRAEQPSPNGGKRGLSHIETSPPPAGRCDSQHEPIASGSTRASVPGRRTRVSFAAGATRAEAPAPADGGRPRGRKTHPRGVASPDPPTGEEMK